MNDVKWDMVPLGLVAEFHTGWTPPSGDDKYYGGGHKWANISDVGSRDLYETERTISDYALERQAGAKPANPGDLLFPFKLSIGAVSFAREKMYTNEAIAVFPPNEKFDIRFFYYALPYFLLKNAGVNIYGAPLLNATLIKQARVPVPPLESQQRIADYLDRETAEIDAAVADLDKYVELLELRARTLIKQQLSGDHPQVKMGLLADAIIGITYSPNDVVEEGGTKVYRSGNVQDSRINRQNMLAVNVEIPPHLRFQEDDILMCSRNGSANLVGKNAIVGPEDLGHTWGAFMTVIRSDLNRYLFWFFRSPQFDAHRGLFSTSTINQLTTGILNRIPVPLPPRGQRDEIVKALELEVEEIDALIAESIKLRDLLLKRRSVLITEVVTGRKRV